MAAVGRQRPWAVLISDGRDEWRAGVVERLQALTFDGRPLHPFEAGSRREAEHILRQVPDIAVALLGNSDNAGRPNNPLVDWIRRDLGNERVRLILEAGESIDWRIASQSEINDIVTPSDLSGRRLAVIMTTALRGYRDMEVAENTRRCVEAAVGGSTRLFAADSLTQFADCLPPLVQFLIPHQGGMLLCEPLPDRQELMVIAAAGTYADQRGRTIGRMVGPVPAGMWIAKAQADQNDMRAGHRAVLHIRHRNHPPGFLYVDGIISFGACDPILVDLLCRQIAVTIDMIRLRRNLKGAQRGIAYSFAHITEYKDQVTGDHLRRIEAISQAITDRLTQKCIFPEIIENRLSELIGLASMLHDVGKVGIPDRVLNKPGRLTSAELLIMRTHALIGEVILSEATCAMAAPSYLQTAVEVAGGHHEKWDGSGYPRGLTGDRIPLSARIVAVADVYDALISPRQYKRIWTTGEAIDLIVRESGRHFDPRIVEAFLAVAPTL